jgi:GT2 family glycosyltransferase
MADRRPVISVVLPTYHRNDLLSLCLDRLAPVVQSYPIEKYEVIVTDDGKETTAEKLIAERYPWAIWVPGPQRGPGANRNQGVRKAQGKWIAFVDDDCLPEPEWLARYDNALEPIVKVYEGCTTCIAPIRPLIEEAPVNLTGGNLWSCNMMIDRETFLETGGFDEAFPYPFQEDADFRERIRARDLIIKFVSDAVVDHPPRPRKSGLVMGRLRECEALMWYKAGNVTPVKSRLLAAIFKQRLKSVMMNPLSPGGAWALRNMMDEYVYVARHADDWDAKYRQRYANVEPEYRTCYL